MLYRPNITSVCFCLRPYREKSWKMNKKKEGRKANPAHNHRNNSASHRISCFREFTSLINIPLTSASERLSYYIYISKHAHENRYPQYNVKTVIEIHTM